MDRFSEHHKDQVLAIVAYYMDMELRGKIMAEAPEAYNRWVQTPVMSVVVNKPSEEEPEETHDEYCRRMERECMEGPSGPS